ncbi:MAG: metal-dependent hydrolase [Gammaproteobacteria bacterium]
MDPISQAFAGASFSQSLTRIKTGQQSAFIAGAMSGMAADLDVLIRSEHDPLLFLEYHRQLTHSLVFIPLGALICAAPLYLFLRNRAGFGELYLYCLLGYASHGLLDACTSYGTQLFWPFSDMRIAWDIISIIDPLFTLPVMFLVIAGVMTSRQFFPRAALVYGLLYLSFGQFQHDRAMDALASLAKQRGHTATNATVKPTLANLFLWKLIYEHDGRYYIDAARIGIKRSYFEGDSVSSEIDLQAIPTSPLQLRDIERFRWFSTGYIARYADDPLLIGDIRYSFLPNTIKPLWGIRLKPRSPDEHVDYVTTREMNGHIQQQFYSMLFGRLPAP